MPTYDYECGACKHRFEKFQSITAPAVRKCPQCGKMKVQRLIGAGAGIIFKGSGFYQTDYRSAGYKKDAKSDSATGSSSSSSAASSSSAGSSSGASSSTPSASTDKPAKKN